QETESNVKEIKKLISIYERTAELYDKNSVEGVKLAQMIDALKESINSLDKPLEIMNRDLSKFTKQWDDNASILRMWKNEAEGVIEGFQSGFFTNAGMGSINTFLDGSFAQMLEGLDSIEDKGERTRKDRKSVV